MKINFNNYDLSEFDIKEGIFCGKPAKLINPSPTGVKWTQKNKIFRSSIWDLEGNLLSASFGKFTNWNENPENFPTPQSLDDCEFINKIDGSTLIVDYLENTWNLRTRGTFSFIGLDNATDFSLVWHRYPLVRELVKDYRQISWLFEIVSPNQRIILDYGPEPDIFLIGGIYKEDYTLLTQKVLDEISKEIHVKRPTRYQFPSFEKMLSLVKEDKEIEGICIYSKGCQEIHKAKADRYLMLHRLKSELSSFDKVVDLYLFQNRPDYMDLYNYISLTFDFELAEFCKENVKKACKLGAETQKILDEIRQFVDNMDKASKKRLRPKNPRHL